MSRLYRAFLSHYVEALDMLADVAGDLKFFVGKRAHRKGHTGPAVFFAQEEGPQLVATARALFPRWSAFILTGLLAGLRWGESAALYTSDIDWRRGRILVQRTWSAKAGRIEVPKDSEGRHVKASPALLDALRAHLQAMKLEGQVKNWTPEQRLLVFPNKAGRVMHTARSSKTSGSRSSPRPGWPIGSTTRLGTHTLRGFWKPERTSGGLRTSSAMQPSPRRPTRTGTHSPIATRPQ